MEMTLYQRLGGSPGIQALVEDVLDRHMRNPAIGPRFRPYLETPDRLAAAKGHLCTFLEAGSGGAAAYQGRGMREAHRGMNISEAEYLAAMDDIVSALDARGVDDQTRKDVLAIAFALKGDIIRV